MKKLLPVLALLSTLAYAGLPPVRVTGENYSSISPGQVITNAAVNLAGTNVTGTLPNAKTTATSSNTASTLLLRDGSGQVAATTFTGALVGNATSATSAVTATSAASAVSFTGSLVGDVSGHQGTTAVDFVGGATSTDVATAAVRVSSSSPNNTANTLVSRDINGDFSARRITADLIGNASTSTSSSSTVSFSGSMVGDVTGTMGTTHVAAVAGYTSTAIGTAISDVQNASSSNTPNYLIRRDGSGNFSAGTITAALSGNASTATSAVSATSSASSVSFTGSLVGDVTGTQGATVVSAVGTSSATNVHAAELLANAATAANTASTLLKRDGSGQVAATTFTGALVGNATTATSAVTAASAGTATTATSAVTATTAVNHTVTDDTTTNGSVFPTWVTAAGTSMPAKVSTSKLTFVPSTGLLSTVTFQGALSGNATTATTATTALSAVTLSGVNGIATGGTGASTKTTGFDALSPLTTLGDSLVGGASGTGTRIPIGSTGQVWTVAGGTATWAAASSANPVYTATAGENLAAGDAVYISVGAADGSRTSGRAYKLDATNASRIEFSGLATAAYTSGGAATFQVAGEYASMSGLTLGAPAFASVTTPGSFQTTAPTSIGQYVMQLGTAKSTTSLLVNGAGSATAVQVTPSSSAPVLHFLKYTGSATFVKATDAPSILSTTVVKITAIGGGGSGGGGSTASGGAGGGGAGGGGTAITYALGSSITASVTISVGLGATPGKTSSGTGPNGSAGATTSFDNLAVATGGSGGTGASSAVAYGDGGAGGIGTTGDILIKGTGGEHGGPGSAGVFGGSGGGGGGTTLGGGAPSAATGTGAAGGAFGGGGSGGGGGSSTSGAGADGGVILEWTS